MNEEVFPGTNSLAYATKDNGVSTGSADFIKNPINLALHPEAAHKA